MEFFERQAKRPAFEAQPVLQAQAGPIRLAVAGGGKQTPRRRYRRLALGFMDDGQPRQAHDTVLQSFKFFAHPLPTRARTAAGFLGVQVGQTGLYQGQPGRQPAMFGRVERVPAPAGRQALAHRKAGLGDLPRPASTPPRYGPPEGSVGPPDTSGG